MKNLIYLVNPSEKDFLDNAGDRIPLGLLSIGANLQKHKYAVKVFDLNHTSESEFYKQFQNEKPFATGVSVYTSPGQPEAIRLAKKLKGQTKLIAGGHHASAMPETLIDYFDIVLVGEGENLATSDLDIDGIWNYNAPMLDDIPNPNYNLLDMNNYKMNQSGMRTGTIITSRGCPNNCSFCGKMYQNIRFEPTEKVLDNIQEFKDRNFEAIYFLDDIFTIKKNRMEQIIKQVKLPFRVTTRANLLDDKRLDSLARYGCDWISLGIESGNNLILKNVNKGMTKEQNLAAVYGASKRGINSKGFFIIGLPGETEKSAKQTIDFSLELKDTGLNIADFYYLVPFPGTAIWNDPDKFGIKIKSRDFTKYLQAGKNARCVVDTEHLKASRIEELVKEANEKWKS